MCRHAQKGRRRGWFCSVFVWVFCGGRPIGRGLIGQRLEKRTEQRVPRMDIHRIRRIEPVCKFGPGGEYLSVWPPGLLPEDDLSGGHLSRLLASLAEIVGVLSGTRCVQATTLTTSRNKTAPTAKETTPDAAARHRPHRRFDPETAPSAPAHRRFPREPMLFPDDSRAGEPAKPQPKHGVRAPRRAAKKVTAVDFAGQGSLFEVDAPRAKTA